MYDKKLLRPDRAQLQALGWVALLSPMIRQLPRAAVHSAGRGAWLSLLLAWFPLAALLWVLRSLLRTRRSGQGLREQLGRALGNTGARIVVGLWGSWLLFYLGYVLRAGADRFVSAIYPETDPVPFLLVMAALALMAGLGRLKVLARFAQVVQPGLLALLLTAGLCALPGIRPEELFPLHAGDLLPALRGVWPAASVLSVAALAAFLPVDADGAAAPPPLVMSGTVLLALLLCADSIGRFGPALTAEMRYPFFSMLRDLRLLGLLERVEALIIVQWVLADFVLSAMLVHICAGNLSYALTGRAAVGRGWAAACALAGTAAACLCMPAASALPSLSRLVLNGHGFWTFVVLPAALLIGRLRRTL